MVLRWLNEPCKYRCFLSLASVATNVWWHKHTQSLFPLPGTIGAPPICTENRCSSSTFDVLFFAHWVVLSLLLVRSERLLVEVHFLLLRPRSSWDGVVDAGARMMHTTALHPMAMWTHVLCAYTMGGGARGPVTAVGMGRLWFMRFVTQRCVDGWNSSLMSLRLCDDCSAWRIWTNRLQTAILCSWVRRI